MIEKKAVVIRAENNRVWLKDETSSACGGCSQKAGCATAALANSMPKRELEMACDQPFEVGDEVCVALENSQFLFASFLLYLVPLLTMLFGVAGASALLPNSNSEVSLVLVSMLSLLAGFRLVNRLQRHSAINPLITKKNVPDVHES